MTDQENSLLKVEYPDFGGSVRLWLPRPGRYQVSFSIGLATKTGMNWVELPPERSYYIDLEVSPWWQRAQLCAEPAHVEEALKRLTELSAKESK